MISAYVITNITNINNIVAQKNVDRYFETEKLDMYYLKYEIGIDAIPAMSRILETEEAVGQNEVHVEIRQYINNAISQLENREFDTYSALAYEAKEYLLNNFRINYSEYDIIIGYRADASYFSFAKDFINGTISYRQLTIAMYLGKLGQQFVLKSKKAFDKLTFIRAEVASNYEWFEKKMNRNKQELNRIIEQTVT